MNVGCKFLALVTLLRIFLCFPLHSWPPIALSEGPVRQRSAYCVAPQISSCNSSRSNSTASGCTHSRYGLEKDLLYNFWSSDSQNRGAFLRTLLAFDLLSGKVSSLRNSTVESIQLGPTLTWWIWTPFPPFSVGLYKSSAIITRGKLCAEEVTSVARESTCVFLLLGIYDKLKDSNPDCKCLTWFKYSCILRSLASNSPWTWPTTSLELENIPIAFPPIFWTMVILTNRALYSTSLFVVEKPNLKDFSIVILSGDIRTSPTLDPLWFATPLCERPCPRPVFIGCWAKPTWIGGVVLLPLKMEVRLVIFFPLD